MKTNESKTENLVQRLNRSMKAIEVVPGTIVKVRKFSFGQEKKYDKNPNFRLIFIDKHGSYLALGDVAENEHLFYLGIEKIGPFNWTGKDKRPYQSLITPWNQEIFAFKLLQGEEYVYLLISHPHDYFQIFIRNLQRVGGITGFGK